MQEEVTRKTVALAIKAAKLDARLLQAALRKLLQQYQKHRDAPHHGKQTLAVSKLPLRDGLSAHSKHFCKTFL